MSAIIQASPVEKLSQEPSGVAAWRPKSGRIVTESFFRSDWFLFERSKLRRAQRGRNLYQLELPLLQFNHRAGTDVLDRGCTRVVWKQFDVLSMLSISPGI
jgi:hypothetical protein